MFYSSQTNRKLLQKLSYQKFHYVREGVDIFCFLKLTDMANQVYVDFHDGG